MFGPVSPYGARVSPFLRQASATEVAIGPGRPFIITLIDKEEEVDEGVFGTKAFTNDSRKITKGIEEQIMVLVPTNIKFSFSLSFVFLEARQQFALLNAHLQMQPFLLLLVSIGVCNAFRLHEAQKFKHSLSAAKTSKREVQFRELMDGIVQHSDEEIELIKSKRNRAIFNGAKAASQNERVVDAFIVLYEDLAPLRIAGNMIFSYLTAQISAAVEEFEKDNKQLIGSMSAGTIKLGRAGELAKCASLGEDLSDGSREMAADVNSYY